MAIRGLRLELAAGEPELALIPVICDHEHDFIDVGANSGVYSLYAQRYARSVLAFEPHPDVAQRLRKVLGSEAVREVALSDHPGTAELSIPILWGEDVNTRSSLDANANPGFNTRQVSVKLETLDNIPTSQVGVIKVDVEGHELAVVRGAIQTLTRDHPTVIIESEERHNAGGVDALKRKLEVIGYDGYFVHRGALRPIGDFEPTEFQSTNDALRVGGCRSPDYINNFIFIHPDRNDHLDAVDRRLKRH